MSQNWGEWFEGWQNILFAEQWLVHILQGIGNGLINLEFLRDCLIV